MQDHTRSALSMDGDASLTMVRLLVLAMPGTRRERTRKPDWLQFCNSEKQIYLPFTNADETYLVSGAAIDSAQKPVASASV